MFYTILYGNEITTRLNRAALDLTKNLHITSRTKGYKILYTRSYNSRTCVYVIKGDLRMLYNGGCKKTIHVFLLQSVLSAYNIHFSVPYLIPCHKLEH